MSEAEWWGKTFRKKQGAIEFNKKLAEKSGAIANQLRQMAGPKPPLVDFNGMPIGRSTYARSGPGNRGPAFYPSPFQDNSSGLFTGAFHGANLEPTETGPDKETADPDVSSFEPLKINDPNFNSEYRFEDGDYQFVNEGIEPFVAVFPNISPEFLEFFKKMQKESPEIAEVMRQEIVQMRKLQANGQTIDAFQLNIQVAKKCLDALAKIDFPEETSMPLAGRIGSFIEKTLNRQNISLKYLEKQNIPNNPFTQALKDLSNQIDEANNEIGFKLGMIQEDMNESREIIGEMYMCIEDLQEGMHRVQKDLSTIQDIQGDMKTVTDYLFEQMTTVSISGFQRCKQVNDLYQELQILKEKQPENKKEIFAKTKNLQKLIAEENETRASFDYALEGLRGCFQLAAVIGAQQGVSPELVKVLRAGDPIFTIAKNLAGAFGYGAAAASTGVLFPALAIAGAAYTLFSIYNEEETPDPFKIILGNIQQIADQVAESRNMTLYGFQHISELINESHIKAHRRFNQVMAQLESSHLEAIMWFERLSVDISFLYKKNSHMSKQLNRIEQKIEQGFKDVLAQPYFTAKREILTFRKENPFTTEKLSDHEKHKYVALFSNFAQIESKNELFSGRKLENLDDLHGIQSELQVTDPENKINLLAQYVTASQGSQSYDLVNPLIWAEGAMTLLEFFKVFPEFDQLQESHRQRIDALIKEGIQVEKFIIDVKTNDHLFETLINEYEQKWLGVMESLKQLIIAEYSNQPGTEEQKFTQLKTTLLAKGHWHQLAREKENKINQLVANLEAKRARGARKNARLVRTHNESTAAVRGRETALGERRDVLVEDIHTSLTECAWLGPVVKLMNHLDTNSNTLFPNTEALYAEALTYGISKRQEGAGAERQMRFSLDHEEKLHSLQAIIAHKREKLEITKKVADEKEQLSDEEAILEYIENLSETDLRQLNQKIQKEASSGKLQEALLELDAYYKLLAVFISLGFRKDSIVDLELKKRTDNLWNQANFNAYLKKYNPKNKESFIFTYVIVKQKFLGKIKQFKRFLLEKKVYPAHYASSNKELKADYPLVDHVIEKLEQFKMFMFKDACRLERPCQENISNRNHSAQAPGSTKRKRSSAEIPEAAPTYKRPRMEELVNNTLTGLINTGNSCYLNASLQMIFCIPDLCARIRDNKNGNSFLQALYAVSTSKIRSSEMLKRLRREVFKIAGPGVLTRGEFQQQDAHEFLVFLFDKLGWAQMTTRSCILFGERDQFKRYEDPQPAHSISIEIVDKNFQKLIDNCFQFEQIQENRTITMEGMDQVYKTWKKALRIQKHHSYLIVHLKLFDKQGKKINTQIEFSEDKIVDVRGKQYEIVGFINHHGEYSFAGHYTAEVKNEQGHWFNCNDPWITKRAANDCGKEAYLVLLKRCKQKESPD